jgi:triosephosphate isomerase
MHLVPSEARDWLEAVRPAVDPVTDRDLFVLPPYPSIPVAREVLAGSNVAWGAQDVHPDDAGAHTGDVSAPMLADLGCRFVEVGHAERRRDHGETPSLVAAKLRAVLRWGMEPIVCVGDPERIAPDAAADALVAELALLLGGLDDSSLGRVVVAYEPVWAIGAGASAAPPEVVEVVLGRMRAWLDRRGPGGQGVRLIYGGSVDPASAGPLLELDAVDGLFVGRSALDPAVFAAIASTAVT